MSEPKLAAHALKLPPYPVRPEQERAIQRELAAEREKRELDELESLKRLALAAFRGEHGEIARGVAAGWAASEGVPESLVETLQLRDRPALERLRGALRRARQR